MSQLIYKKEDREQLMKKLTNIQNIETIKIATAFISNSNEVKKFLSNLSDKIKDKEKFEIYLSADFSPKDKVEILNFLQSIAKVYIIHNLHAKAYYISGKEELFAFGSSNLTNNGFGNNLELMQIKENIEKNEVVKFFEYCKKNAIVVTEEIENEFKQIDEIAQNIDNNKEIKELYAKIKEVKSKLIIKEKTKYEYENLTDYYFTEEDFETFNQENSKKNNKEINTRRDVVKDKLLKINSEIIEEINKKYKLYNHWKTKNIIAPSGARPNAWNNFSLSWLGIRYLRKEVEEIVTFMKKTNDDLDDFGANKFTCFQINLSYEEDAPSFEVGIFHSVPNWAYDREKVIENLQNNNHDIRQNFTKVIKNLKGEALKFHSYNKETRHFICI